MSNTLTLTRRMPRPALLRFGLVALATGVWFALSASPTAGQSADHQASGWPPAPTPSAVVGKQAPLWEVPTWGNLPQGIDGLEIDDFEGKTVYLYCFQSWCPGCHSHGFPTLKKVREHYAGNDNIAFIAVQTVFEGFSSNQHDRGIAIVTEKFGLDIPVGHSGTPETPSKLMHNYRTRGTPWTLIIGPDRVLHYGDFHIQPNEAIQLIDGLQP